MRTSTEMLGDIERAEFARLQLNLVLSERGETHRSSVELWVTYRVVAEAVRRAAGAACARSASDETRNPDCRRTRTRAGPRAREEVLN